MDLETKSEENLAYMLDGIRDKLQLVNAQALNPEGFELSRYEEVKDLYELIISKDNISVSEMEAIVAEIASLKA
ncbi:DUF1128 domain-containing protein [Salsuginibacillus kocurii]|uniref:DUF1128 domain-containing protein n=1 Tax=Salsuginibacillus kocurii TaxID=427078 RepID=UPI00035CAE4C|nr:DUF1128 domain-containing protein [Salsuginibacillus kocurii]